MPTLKEQVADLERARTRTQRDLRSALGSAARAGMTERQIAAEVGKSQPEVHRLLTASSARSADGRPRTWMNARAAATAARHELRAGQELMAFKKILQALDQLADLEDPDDIAEWAVTPARIPHPGLDTLLQALTKRAFRSRGLDVPAWARPHRLDQEWVMAALPSRTERVRARAPKWLTDLGIYVSDRDLVTM